MTALPKSGDTGWSPLERPSLALAFVTRIDLPASQRQDTRECRNPSGLNGCPAENVVADVLGAVVLLPVRGLAVQSVGVSERPPLGWNDSEETATLDTNLPNVRPLDRLRLAAESHRPGRPVRTPSQSGNARDRRRSAAVPRSLIPFCELPFRNRVT